MSVCHFRTRKGDLLWFKDESAKLNKPITGRA